MARRGAQEKAAYAALIARFAAAPGTAHTAALAAPMACPVLGETSIIHRLRSLAMSDLSPRRRMAGRALLGAGLLALPLTASITYAAGEGVLSAPEVPEVPEPPAPPAPPAPPSAPDAPEAPEAPEPPAVVLMSRDGKGGAEVTEHVWRDADGKERRVKMVFRNAPEAEALARDMEARGGARAADHQAMMAELRAGLAEADRALADLPRIIEEAMAESEAARAEGQRRVVVKHECKPGSGEVTETTAKGGVQVISICRSRIMAEARQGLVEARAEIAADKDIPEDTRKQILRTLDAQIARWSRQEG